jgi:hypothetical protein
MQKKEKHATQTTASKNIERRQESEKQKCIFPKITLGSKLRREAELKIALYDFHKTAGKNIPRPHRYLPFE